MVGLRTKRPCTTYNGYWRGVILDTSFNDAASCVKTYIDISPPFYKKAPTAILSYTEFCSGDHTANSPL
jgi:hypothetical protein